MINPRLLQYVDEVTRSGSIRRAAEKLNVSASSVNRQIIGLEERLGTPLFERLPRLMRPTPAGELLVEHARQTLRNHERVLAQIETLKGARYTRASIATVGGLAGELLIHALAEYRREKPFTRFSVSVMSAEAVAAAVLAEEAELGFAFDLPRNPRLAAAVSIATPCGAVVKPGHALADRKRVALNELAAFPLIVAQQGVTVRDHLDLIAARQGLRLEPALESNSFDLLKQFAHVEGAVAILNRIDVVHSRLNGLVRFIPIVEMRGFAQELSVVHRARRSLQPLPAQLLERLRELLAAVRNT